MGLALQPPAGNLHTFATEVQIKPNHPTQEALGALQGWSLETLRAALASSKPFFPLLCRLLQPLSLLIQV